MSNKKTSAKGERAAMGGYIPQFKAFAMFAYKELVDDNLEWIKIADPDAEKLDDIQYSTSSEIHAYQVKWTINAEKISYANFKKLLPLIAISWKKIKSAITQNKKVVPHLLTNKELAKSYRIKIKDKKIGTFKEFFEEAWTNSVVKTPYPKKWIPVFKDLEKASTLSTSDFKAFINLLVFEPNFKARQSKIIEIEFSQKASDLNKFYNFILEEVADPKRIVKFKKTDIIQALGWENRVKTKFNHELVVNHHLYQPITLTIDLLNQKLAAFNKGYIFLIGSPGAGKSTLLTEWSKDREERIVKYYAFDFTDPSSVLNYDERGNSTFLLFDLVSQFKNKGIYTKNILPYEDLQYLREVFYKQLKKVGEDYKKTGRKTILIIDGLDHVPREYKPTTSSFLRELPLPNIIPNGVYIILGSQSYDFEDIKTEIKKDFKEGNRTIEISPLSKSAVYQYIVKASNSILFSDNEKKLIFKKSQGHPLYLSYLVSRIQTSNDKELILNNSILIDGDIDNYYNKIWTYIEKDVALIEFLGLLTRVRGDISLSFIKEWNRPKLVLKKFKEKAKFLFNETTSGLNFFHNSFKQFLLYKTAIDYLVDEYDEKENIAYHKQLANFYDKSSVEPKWERNYHLYKGKEYSEFIDNVTPKNFERDYLEYRHINNIIQDAKIGIRIAKEHNDLILLLRYLFVIAHYERREYHLEETSIIEPLLILNKKVVAKNYLRAGSNLYYKNIYVTEQAVLFKTFGEDAEGELLFNLAYPTSIQNEKISLKIDNNYQDEKELLIEWVKVAPNFTSIEQILQKVNHIEFQGEKRKGIIEKDTELTLRLKLLIELCFSLINLHKWNELNLTLKEIDFGDKANSDSIFYILHFSIEENYLIENAHQADLYLDLLLSYYHKTTTKPTQKIYIADLIYKVKNNIQESFEWIKENKQPSLVNENRLYFDTPFSSFIPLIRYNKLLNLSGYGVSIIKAIPSIKGNAKKEVLVEFERMLCLITQIFTDGILSKPFYESIKTRVFPIVNFYYKDFHFSNTYWYKLQSCKNKYFDFLIHAVSKTGEENLIKLAEYLFQEFVINSKYWGAGSQRYIIEELLKTGYSIEKLKKQLIELESFMLLNKDINGRIEECISQSKIWFELKEFAHGEKWIKQALSESSGVGYRKDYQFNEWIEWLQKVNKKTPDKAGERILWFLSHLPHLEETTEGGAYHYACDLMLKTTFDWNFAAGFTQLKWQLEKGLVDFEDSMEYFLSFYFQNVSIESEYKAGLQTYTNLFLYICSSARIELLKLILLKGYSIHQQEFLTKYLSQIINAISTLALESIRDYLLEIIEDFAKQNKISIKDYFPDVWIPKGYKKNEDNNSKNFLTLKSSGEKIAEKEVLERVNSFEDFIKLIDEEYNSLSNFNWSKVLDKIAPTLSSKNLEACLKIENLERRDIAIYAKLSDFALQINDKGLAIKLAEKALKLSGESGWATYFDGGTRIKAFSIFQKIDPILAAKKAFKLFSHDIICTKYNVSPYAESLGNILPLFKQDFDLELFWEELFDYLQRLMQNSSPIKDLPKLELSQRPILEILTDYLLYLSESPVNIVSNRAMKVLAYIIKDNNEYAVNQLLKYNIKNQKTLNVLDTILMYLLELKAIQLNSFDAILSDLAISKNYLVRRNAHIILKYLGKEIPKIKPIVLSSSYRFYFPKSFEEKKEPVFTQQELENPENLIRPFGLDIKFLSRVSGLREINLLYRVQSIMKEIGSFEMWTDEYEKQLRSKLENINLKFSFTRPRVVDTRNAIMCLITELLDSNTIMEEELGKLFLKQDYATSFIQPISKPTFIPPLRSKDIRAINEDWTESLEQHPRLNETIISYLDNQNTIGEYTFIQSLDSYKTTEIYMSQLNIDRNVEKKIGHIFGMAYHEMIKDYYQLSSLGRYIIIVGYFEHNSSEFQSNWLAFNPVFAKHLDWIPDKNKLFGWKDKNGDFMAESFYWSNGNIDRSSPYSKNEVGQGWFVTVSDKALEQIRQTESVLFIQKSITQVKYIEGMKKKNKEEVISL